MTEELLQAEDFNIAIDHKNSVEQKKGKKASWLHTILWMLSMVVLANIGMSVIAYFLFFHNK